MEPGAEIYLFGSRARGDHKPDSDWDLLVLLDNCNNENREKIIFSLFQLELESGFIFNIIVRSKLFWDNNKVFLGSPFRKNVENDKLIL